MKEILTTAKNIHPSQPLDLEELTQRYIDLYPNDKRDVEFFINGMPQNCSPLFISGQIGSGKTTLLKSLLSDKSDSILYCDISEYSFFDNKEPLEVVLVIIKEVLKDIEISSESGIEPINNLLRKIKINFGAPSESEIESKIKSITEKYIKKEFVVIVDGLDRFLEQSDYKTVRSILFDCAYIWKIAKVKLIFVTPLHFCLLKPQLNEYRRIYSTDSLEQTHIVLHLQKMEDVKLWRKFIEVRAKIQGFTLSDEQIYNIVEMSGSLPRSILLIIFNIAKILYRKGDNVVRDEYLDDVKAEIISALNEQVKRLELEQLQELVNIASNNIDKIPDAAISLFLKSNPLALYTVDGCQVHPLLDLEALTNELDAKKSATNIEKL